MDLSGPDWERDLFFFKKNRMLNKSEKNSNIGGFALGMVAYSGASIIGPILVFGTIGYFLDKAYNGRHLILLSSIFIAFVVTNILIFRKARGITAELKKYAGNGKNGYDEDDKENDK
jgi:F0F1-type ATP synthase assembly protein I